MAVVMLHVYKTWNWLLLNLSLEGYMRSMCEIYFNVVPLSTFMCSKLCFPEGGRGREGKKSSRLRWKYIKVFTVQTLHACCIVHPSYHNLITRTCVAVKLSQETSWLMHKDNGKEELRLTLSEITELMTYCKAWYLHHCNFKLTCRND